MKTAEEVAEEMAKWASGGVNEFADVDWLKYWTAYFSKALTTFAVERVKEDRATYDFGEVREEALEEAAKVADEHAGPLGSLPYIRAAKDIAHAIRALKAKP